MRINLRRLDGGVPQQILNRADINSILQQVRCKRVPQSMTGDPLIQPRLESRLTHRCLIHSIQHMMPTFHFATWIHRNNTARPQPLPTPFLARILIPNLRMFDLVARRVPAPHQYGWGKAWGGETRPATIRKGSNLFENGIIFTRERFRQIDPGQSLSQICLKQFTYFH